MPLQETPGLDNVKCESEQLVHTFAFGNHSNCLCAVEPYICMLWGTVAPVTECNNQYNSLTMNCSGTSNVLSNSTGIDGSYIYCWCMLIFAYIPIVTLTVIVLVAVIGAKGVPGTIRFVLVNILAASLITIAGTAMALGSRIISTSTNNLCPSDTACRIYYWVIYTGGTARLSFMATYAVVVFVIIRHSNTAVRPIILLLSVLGIWIFVISFNALVFSSQIVESNYLGNSGCVPHAGTQLWALYVVPFTIIFVLFPVTLAISLPCVAIWFIKNNKQEGRPRLSKPIVKFTLFLLLGNVLGVLGQAMPVLLATITWENGNTYNQQIDAAVKYSDGILLTISFIPTPILILVSFKPVWSQLQKILLKFPLWLYSHVHCSQKLSSTFSLRQNLLFYNHTV